jgi:hypothetical protein
MKARALLATGFLLLAAGCSPGAVDEGAGGSWAGTITTEGDVTTVINESGSVWGGTATLVEEASIGVDIGEDAYMFGYVGRTWATEERIYVTDAEAPAVRVYDLDGNHLLDIGREGQGPGEFQRPGDLLVSPSGLLYVRDSGPGGPINVYTEEGEHVETLRADPMLSSGWPMVFTHDGELFTPVRGNPEQWPEVRVQGMGIPGRDGVVGEPLTVPTLDFESVSVRVNERAALSVPFAPRHTWAMSPSGAFVVGISDDYRFEIHEPGGYVTLVQRVWAREPVDPAEADWERRSTMRSGRRFVEAWNWDGAEIPAYKRSYSSLSVDAGGRIWVIRRGPSRRIEDCDEDPLEVTEGSPRRCWEYDILFDLFDEEGRLLTSGIESPRGLSSLNAAFIRDDTFVAPIEDELGTIMVKRFRLAVPETETDHQ